MKRLLIGLFVLSLVISANAFAKKAPAVKVKPLLVTVPVQNAGWHVGAEALYLQPSGSDLDYAVITATPTSPSRSNNAATVKTKHKFGFGIDAGYHFAGTGSDLSAHYERLHSDFSSSVNGYIWSRIVQPSWSRLYTRASARAKFEYDAFDLLAGQLVNVGKRLQMHVSAGARYVDLSSSLDTTYYADGPDTINLRSDFKGIGPCLAMDGSYNLYRGFGIDAAVGTSLLIGSMKSRNHELFYQEVNQVIYTPVNLDKTSARHIVPELDLKLGLSYKHLMRQGTFAINLGWKVINYFAAQDRMFWTDNVADTNYIHNITSVGFNGPYLGFVFQTA